MLTWWFCEFSSLSYFSIFQQQQRSRGREVVIQLRCEFETERIALVACVRLTSPCCLPPVCPLLGPLDLVWSTSPSSPPTPPSHPPPPPPPAAHPAVCQSTCREEPEVTTSLSVVPLARRHTNAS